jgi:shikimate kinase
VVKSTSENARKNSKNRKVERSKKRPGGKSGARGSTRVRRNKAPHAVAAPGGAVFLVGFMGAGKSSVGRALGQNLHWDFEDLDDRIVQRERRSVAEIFRDSGEAEFRRAEHAALRQVLEELSGGAAKIVALGGGAFVQTANAALLQAAGVPTVFLDAPVAELWQRCRRQASETGTERPLFQSMEQFRKLFGARRKGYLKSSCKVATGGRTVDEIAAEIAKSLGLKAMATRTEQGEVE